LQEIRVSPTVGPVMKAHTVLRFEISAFSDHHISDGDKEYAPIAAKAFEFANYHHGYKEVSHVMTSHPAPQTDDVVKESVFHFEAR
jgi:hypothetical protein